MLLPLTIAFVKTKSSAPVVSQPDDQESDAGGRGDDDPSLVRGGHHATPIVSQA